MSTFVNLHCHDMFSIGDAIARPEDNARRAKALGMNALATTNHGSLAGWLQHKEACAKVGIKPIFGFEAYFVEHVETVYGLNTEIASLKTRIRLLEKKSATASEKVVATALDMNLRELEVQRDKLKKYNHLILLAKNWKGCTSLIKLHNAAVIDGTYYKPRLDWNVLERYVSQGDVIATSACLGGRLSKLVAQAEYEQAKSDVMRFNAIFGKGNFYIELQLNQEPLQATVNRELIELAEATGTPTVITCDSHFAEPGGHATRGLIRKLGEEDYANSDDQLIDLYIKNETMLLEAWTKYMGDLDKRHLIKAIKNTRHIADSIQDFPFDTSLKFPTFETGNDDDQNLFLRKAALKGLMAKGLHTKPKYIERLKMELKTIEKLGFSSYFNVVGDLVGSAREEQPVGPGRGSAASSMVAYCVGITNVDPLKFDLFFERFLDQSKGIVMPTFGLQIAQMSIDYDELLKKCECHED